MIVHIVRISLLVIMALILLSACGPPEEASPEPLPTLPGLDEAPASQPTDVIPDAPAPEVVAPVNPAMDTDYPAPPTYEATVDPYPGGLVWVIRPVGIQCEDGTSPGYGDLRQATSTLTAAGVTVAKSEMTELLVSAVCGSPTSAHFRVQIAADDLQTALSMDWMLE